jgi:hypothetical protein
MSVARITEHRTEERLMNDELECMWKVNIYIGLFQEIIPLFARTDCGNLLVINYLRIFYVTSEI